MSYTDLYKLISNPWSSVKEIQKIAKCGRDTAIRIRNDIESEINKSGKKLPTSKTIYVPTKNVAEKLNLDMGFIFEMAMNEQKLNRAKNYATVSE